MKLLFALLFTATFAAAACPTWVARPEVYPVGTVVTSNGTNYEVIRDLGNGWIEPTNTWFWSTTANTCAGLSSSSSSNDLAQVLANQATILSMLAELKVEHAQLSRDIAKIGSTGEFTDARDGQVYPWVKIGTQTWMARNLNYFTSASECATNLTLCATVYGRYYTQQDAITSCPVGWHLPSFDDLIALTSFAGADAAKFKAANPLWTKNTGNNEFGFSAMPAGYFANNTIQQVNESANWWSSSDVAGYPLLGWFLRLNNFNYDALEVDAFEKTTGLSVRCIKN